MRCEIFLGKTPQAVVTEFNEWAKGKRLAKDMIIQSVMSHSSPDMCPDLAILIFHADEKEADVPKPEVKNESAERCLKDIIRLEQGLP